MSKKISTYKPGQKAPKTGQYVIVGPKGRSTGETRVITRNEPFPPTPDKEMHYILRGSSGSIAGSGARVIRAPQKTGKITKFEAIKAARKIALERDFKHMDK